MYQTVETDKTDSPLLAILMLATTLCTIITIVAVIVLFYWWQEDISEKYVNEGPTSGRQIMAEQGAGLSDYRWIDKESGKVSIPMETVKRELLNGGE